MLNSTTLLTQSKYFSSVFNGAIFDGPVRLYFAQYHEGLALEIYFHIEGLLRSTGNLGSSRSRNFKKHIFMLLYPTHELFIAATESQVTEGAIGTVVGTVVGTVIGTVIGSGVPCADSKIYTGALGDDLLLAWSAPMSANIQGRIQSVVRNILGQPSSTHGQGQEINAEPVGRIFGRHIET